MPGGSKGLGTGEHGHGIAPEQWRGPTIVVDPHFARRERKVGKTWEEAPDYGKLHRWAASLMQVKP